MRKLFLILVLVLVGIVIYLKNNYRVEQVPYNGKAQLGLKGNLTAQVHRAKRG